MRSPPTLPECRTASRLHHVVTSAGGPELVNDGVDTAPSKRISAALPRYSKTIDGPLCIQELGLAKLRATCPHLDAWLTELERRVG
ncbi:DUF4276 family protein [Natronosporangium hydrolyticum]